MRKIVSVLVAIAAAASTALAAAPASAVIPPTVVFYVDGYRVVGSATHLPAGKKSCGFERSQTNPGMIIGSFGNDMISVGNRRTAGDSVTIRSRHLPAGKYLLRMSCFIKNRKPKRNQLVHEIVAVNEQWIHVTTKPQTPRIPKPQPDA